MEELIFEWDECKNIANIRKHKVSFEYARFVFLDPFRKTFYDVNHSREEERYYVLGMVDSVLYVVYTVNDDGVIRLISARRATGTERSIYGYNGKK